MTGNFENTNLESADFDLKTSVSSKIEDALNDGLETIEDWKFIKKFSDIVDFIVNDEWVDQINWETQSWYNKLNTQSISGYLKKIESKDYTQIKADAGAMFCIQTMLYKLGFGKEVQAIDGKYRTLTFNATVAFQKKYNKNVPSSQKLIVDGAPGPRTITAMLSSFNSNWTTGITIPNAVSSSSSSPAIVASSQADILPVSSTSNVSDTPAIKYSPEQIKLLYTKNKQVLLNFTKDIDFGGVDALRGVVDRNTQSQKSFTSKLAAMLGKLQINLEDRTTSIKLKNYLAKNSTAIGEYSDHNFKWWERTLGTIWSLDINLINEDTADELDQLDDFWKVFWFWSYSPDQQRKNMQIIKNIVHALK